MATIPPAYLVHEITVEAYAGTSGAGVELYATAVTVRCLLEDKRRRVTGPTGDEVISESTAYALPSTVAPVQSRATLPDGRVATVIQALARDGGGLPTPDHLEIVLT